MVRRFFPKGTDFTQIADEVIKAAEAWINKYPREIHGFLSADAVFEKALSALC
jgi:IS30 family transposase